MKNRILITGASGFIGSFLVEEALRQGYEVVAGIRKTSSSEFLPKNEIRFLEMDLSSVESLRITLLEEVHSYGPFMHIVHNAGTTGTKGNADFMEVNYQYTCNLVDILMVIQALKGKFLFVSSLAASGPGDPISFEPIRLDANENPVSSYGKSKWKAEQYIKSKLDFPFLIIKPTAVYGPRDRDILQFFRLINKGFEPYIGRHRQMISMIYVKDLARSVLGLLNSLKVQATYIISDGFDYDKEQMGTLIKILLNKKTFKIKIPVTPLRIIIGVSELIHKMVGQHPFLNREKLDEISHSNWLCEGQAVWKEISLKPFYSLNEGLKETISWYKSNGWLK